MPKVIEIELKLNVPKIIQIDLSKVGPPGQSADDTDTVYVNPVSVLANYDVPLPSHPADKKRVVIHFGGTIAPGDPVVDALTVSVSGGDILYQPITPVAALGGDVMIYEYQASTSLWRRVQ
jgi:hypothetical protein